MTESVGSTIECITPAFNLVLERVYLSTFRLFNGTMGWSWQEHCNWPGLRHPLETFVRWSGIIKRI